MSAVTEILIISDLHLSADEPAVIELFKKFVYQRAINCNALYILGDFFEVWLGDDDPATELNDVFDCFKYLSTKNIPVFFMRGNRDFLVQKEFEQRCHCTVIEEPYSLEIDNRQFVLMHGDSLCTDDTDYQQFKQTIRNPEWIEDFLAKPLVERKEIAAGLRKMSKSETSMKKEVIMDVNQQAVLAAFKQHNTQWLIHGHTHRPDFHSYQSDGIDLTRVVLGDWHQSGSVLSIKSQPGQTEPEVVLEPFD